MLYSLAPIANGERATGPTHTHTHIRINSHRACEEKEKNENGTNRKKNGNERNDERKKSSSAANNNNNSDDVDGSRRRQRAGAAAAEAVANERNKSNLKSSKRITHSKYERRAQLHKYELCVWFCRPCTGARQPKETVI